jgi:hypothetical protein
MATPTPLPNYHSYKDLPPLAGLCTLEEAAKPGLSVEECVRRLKRFHYAFKRLHEILTARITSEPIYELKTAFAHHAYLCAEHATALRQRVAEMREPPLGLDEVPHPALEVFFDEIRAAPTTEELIYGLSSAVTVLWSVVCDYLSDTHPLTDAPSRRMLRFARIELDDMMQWYSFTMNALVDAGSKLEESLLARTQYLAELLERAGGLGGLGGTRPASEKPIVRRNSATPFHYDPIPQRDERFSDPWNQGVNAEAFLYDEAMPAKAKALMMLFKRLREIDVPEMMASIITETKGKPWGYYRDMSRQLWDEARHAMMGEVGFVALGVDWTQAKVTWNWSYRLNTECTPRERHGVLYFIEQGLMPKTGKRYEFETAKDSGIPLMATIQDFDWADEVLHSQIGRLWLVPEFGTLQQCLDYGDRAWSKILSNWQAVKAKGLTEHANWWPAVYDQACAAAGEKPDPAVRTFAVTYDNARADLKRIAAE